MRRAQSTWAPLGLWQGKPLSRHEGPRPASGTKIFQIQRIAIGQWLIDLQKEEMKDTLRNSSSSVEDQPGLTDLVQLISERYARSAGRRVAMTHHVREATLWPNLNMPQCLNATWIFLAPDAVKPKRSTTWLKRATSEWGWHWFWHNGITRVEGRNINTWKDCSSTSTTWWKTASTMFSS